MHFDDDEVAPLPFCELHTNTDEAKLVLYENELCQVHLMAINILSDSECIVRQGVRSSCFKIDAHNFSARTIWERKLWVRAIANVKVKLQHNAGTTPDTLATYRNSIKEFIHAAKSCSEEYLGRDPLLPSSPSKVYGELALSESDVATRSTLEDTCDSQRMTDVISTIQLQAFVTEGEHWSTVLPPGRGSQQAQMEEDLVAEDSV